MFALWCVLLMPKQMETWVGIRLLGVLIHLCTLFCSSVCNLPSISGALVTAGVLTAGLVSFRYGNSRLGQKLMRARVVAQGVTVALMVGSAYYYGDQIKLFKKGSSPWTWLDSGCGVRNGISYVLKFHLGLCCSIASRSWGLTIVIHAWHVVSN